MRDGGRQQNDGDNHCGPIHFMRIKRMYFKTVIQSTKKLLSYPELRSIDVKKTLAHFTTQFTRSFVVYTLFLFFICCLVLLSIQLFSTVILPT